MKNLQLVKSENFGTVQCDFWQDDKGDILMTREQIGRALEYSDPQKAIDNIHSRNKDRLDKFSVTLKLRATDGKMYYTKLYTAKGIYEICRFSRQPKADKFMDWVWDVVESIRKHGAYMTPQRIEEVLLNPDTIIQLATALKEEQQKRLEAERLTNQIAVSENSILVRELAKVASKKGIVIGEKRLWNKLREWGLIFKNSTEPKQEYIDRGYFEVVEGVTETNKGTFTYRTTKVTGKGQIYIIKRLIEENMKEIAAASEGV